MSEHGLLSPSAAHRWLKCPPSARLEETIPNEESSTYAEEGTLAHHMAWAKVFYKYKDVMSEEEYKNVLKNDRGNKLHTPEMDDATDRYLEIIDRQVNKYKNKPNVFPEVRVKFSDLDPGCFGTADCIIVGSSKITVIDLKYGKGIYVEAKNNYQLLLYAIGAVEQYKAIYDIKAIDMIIVQPRISKDPSVWSLTREELEDKKREIEPLMMQAIEGKGEYNAGDWCRWCKAKATCKKHLEWIFRPTERKDPATIPPEELGKYIQQAEELSAWLSDVKDYATKQLIKGQKVPGYKLVAGRSLRRWIDTDKAFKTIVDKGLTKEELLYTRQPLSVAQVEKLLGKKTFKEISGELVETPEGKPTLVPESDNRPAITTQPTAAEVFKK